MLPGLEWRIFEIEQKTVVLEILALIHNSVCSLSDFLVLDPG
jgi:hypothetical protein